MDAERIRNASRVARVLAERALRRAKEAPSRAYRGTALAYHGRDGYLAKRAPVIRSGENGSSTEVDLYWNQHTVNSVPFATASESTKYLEWRFEEYPLFREFAALWGDHDGEVVLDYGCGPGNDVTGFLIHTGATKVIGVDVSRKALELTRRRIALHGVDLDRVGLILASDADPGIPLPDDSVDYFQSMGVVHVTTDPGAILRELNRVLKPGRIGRVMVYNRHSVWFHLYTAYVKMVLEGRYAGMSVEDAFHKTTDGEDCPIARSYSPEEFEALCRSAGFEVDYIGGHHSRHELGLLDQYGEQAVADTRLDARHRDFIRDLRFDEHRYPLWEGKHAGVGAVYELRN